MQIFWKSNLKCHQPRVCSCISPLAHSIWAPLLFRLVFFLQNFQFSNMSVDALPYIDQGYDESAREAVKIGESRLIWRNRILVFESASRTQFLEFFNLLLTKIICIHENFSLSSTTISKNRKFSVKLSDFKSILLKLAQHKPNFVSFLQTGCSTNRRRMQALPANQELPRIPAPRSLWPFRGTLILLLSKPLK